MEDESKMHFGDSPYCALEQWTYNLISRSDPQHIAPLYTDNFNCLVLACIRCNGPSSQIRCYALEVALFEAQVRNGRDVWKGSGARPLARNRRASLRQMRGVDGGHTCPESAWNDERKQCL